MNTRIKDKIVEIETYLEELHEIVPENLKEYTRDFKSKAACERYAERIITAIIDLALLVIKDKNLRLPETDLQALISSLKAKPYPLNLLRACRMPNA